MNRRVSICALLLAVGLIGVPTASFSADEKAAIAPDKKINLLEGDSLAQFTTWLAQHGHQDPNKVFTVKDGVLHVSGEGDGYIATKNVYRDYHLSFEYRWGQARSNQSKYVRNSGVLLHGHGPDGAAGGKWMTTVEVQLAQGCEGDFILIQGKDADGKPIVNTISSEVELAPDGRRTRYKPGGKKIKYSGRQMWWKDHDLAFEEFLDTRGRNDLASKTGEWTRVDCICSGDRITVKINGQTVNAAFDVKPAAGKILFQNEEYEVFFRNIELAPVKSQASQK